MQLFTDFIHKSKYSRYLDDKSRRETWEETVQRYTDFLRNRFGSNLLPEETLKLIHDAVLNYEVMPSMRLLMTAGPAVERDNVAAFNCSYVAIDNPRAFDEIVYILMCGTGVGFSCEQKEIEKLPVVAEEFSVSPTTIKVQDSKIGWAKAYKELIALLYSGQVPSYDLSLLRPKGARLKVFGGRSSGPQPLQELFDFTIHTFKNAAGRRLNSLEVHDIVCKIGSVVVSGGVRRSALISLSNLSDDRMRHAKTGDWYNTQPQRMLANNSAAYVEHPDMQQFMEEWLSLYKSKSGERGIFNRLAAYEKCEEIGRKWKDKSGEPIPFGTNPCGEIILRSGQFCNLTEIVARSTDTEEDLFRKARIATIMGTLQSALTDFQYIRKKWKDNTDEERLLGVSITGIMDCPLLNNVSERTKNLLADLREEVRQVNEDWAIHLGIPSSAAITCVKPSGTVSSLVNSASGIHARYSKYYIRRAQSDLKDPITHFMIEQGFPHEPASYNKDLILFSFPMKAPDGAITTADLTGIQALELWLMYRTYWTDHNPSVTINLQEHEWMEAGAWVYKHFDKIGGVSFFPADPLGTVYKQAVFEPISEEDYNDLLSRMPKNVDWTRMIEETDETTSSQELACVGGVCDIS